MVLRLPWARPIRAYLLGPLCCALVRLRVPPAAGAPLRPPRPTPAPGPESLGPRERRRHDAPSRLQPLPNAAGSGPGPGTNRTSRLLTPLSQRDPSLLHPEPRGHGAGNEALLASSHLSPSFLSSWHNRRGRLEEIKRSKQPSPILTPQHSPRELPSIQNIPLFFLSLSPSSVSQTLILIPGGLSPRCVLPDSSLLMTSNALLQESFVSQGAGSSRVSQLSPAVRPT